MRALEPESRARGVRVRRRGGSRISGWSEVDPLRLREVVINLVANAILHSHSGATVSLAVTQTSDWLVISVKDNGPGIALPDSP